MSKQMDLLEIDKWIASRLWYTSLLVYHANSIGKYFHQKSNNPALPFSESDNRLRHLIYSQENETHPWIKQVLLNSLFGNVSYNVKSNVQKQFKHIQMEHALQLCQNMQLQEHKKLLSLYDHNMENMSPEETEKLYIQCFSFLKSKMQKCPDLVCWIINELVHGCFNKNSNATCDLEDLFICTLKQLLEPTVNSEPNQSQLFEQKSMNNDTSIAITLCILSRMIIIESKTNDFLSWLYPMLLKTSNTKDIELSLYSRDDSKFFREWSAFLSERYARDSTADSWNNASRIRNAIFCCKNNSGILINKNELLQRTTKSKLHWLVDIVDICYVLMMAGRCNDVSSILMCRLLNNFWPLILFKLLEDNSHGNVAQSEISSDQNMMCDAIKFIMDKCNLHASKDSALRALNNMINKHVKIVDSVLKWRGIETSTLQEASETIGRNIPITDKEQPTSVRHMFFLLQHLNILSVLKIITNIHEQHYDKVINLLVEIGESRDVFQAYSCMLSAIKAILLSESYNTKYKLIIGYLSDMKERLDTLYPLSLRMQVIENIFSLLFLRHEDFNPVQNHSDEENISTSDEKSRLERKQVDHYLTGFICNKYAMRDMLVYLKDIVLTTGIEHVKWKTEVGYTEQVDRVQKSISAITAAIIDAKWRMELYTSSRFIENVGKPDEPQNHSSVKSEILLNGKSIRSEECSSLCQEDSTSDEMKIKSDSSSESGLIYNSVKWRRRFRNVPSVDSPGTKDKGLKPFFVNLMLASRESLIIHCLWKGDYTRAQEVLEISDMKNTQLSAEVSFSRALQTFKENINCYSPTLKDKDLRVESPQTSILESIRLAAQEGVQSSRQTNQLETFLASQEFHLRTLNSDVLNSNETLTICVLDLALTMSQYYTISNNLCDVAMKYLKLCKTFDNTECAHFFCQIYQLLYENKDVLSLTDILCDVKIPLSTKDYKEKNEFWSDVKIKHHEFKNSQANKNTINKILKDNNYLPGVKALGRIIALCSTLYGGNEKYLQNICSHLQLLHSIIPTNEVICTVSDLLELSLHHYFGHQIFDLEIEPNKLETIAQSFQLNLVYSILINACPRLLHETNLKCNIHTKNFGCTVLNKTFDRSQQDSSHANQGPNMCVSEILAELLSVLRKLCPNELNISQTTYKNISKDPEIRAILRKTSRLASLDLSELSVGEETLTFFLNTWNIMFIHASLTVWMDHPPSNNLWHTVSLMSVGYIIGDLGLVTLAALRSKLLDNVMSNNSLFMEVEELNEPAWQDLDITHDPRVMFVMANEFYGTPRVRLCNVKTLNADLNDAFHEYLDFYASITRKPPMENSRKEKMLLPDLVHRYELFRSQSFGNNTHNVDNNEELLSPEEYLKISERNMIIKYMTPSYLYNITLKYSSVPHVRRPSKMDQHALEWKNRSVRSSLLQYLEGHCWILSYLLQRIHNESPTILENNCDNLNRTACLENFVISPWAEAMKPLFEDNQTLAAIHETIPVEKLWSYFEIMLKNNKWNTCLALLNALQDSILLMNAEMQCFKDKILSHTVSKMEAVSSTEVLRYLYQIKDIHVLAQTVLYNISKWHVNVCEHALLHVLHHVDNYKLPMHSKLKMKEILHRVLIFYKMLPYCISKPNSTWYDVAYCTEKIDPFQILKSLMNAEKFELCLEWLECQAFSLEIQFSMTQDFLIGLLKNEESQNFSQALKLLQVLPLNQSVKMCKSVLKKMESVDALQFVANYLLEHCKGTESIKYRRTLLGIDILRMLEVKERPLYIHLIKEPLLMLEQLLMNCKFESIQKILNEVRQKLEEVGLSISSFDKTIRFYAQRSLDFRVCLQRDGIESKPRNLQQATLDIENVEFIMPSVVPTKEEWMPNEKARECSCCKTVIFSMFNRRHHCRRCGRVICAICSQHRMQVSGYPSSVPVRVCDDCKRQTVCQMRVVQGSSSTASSEIFDHWRLTRDQTHNQTIREEFSFEYAPNISLCLAILNLHSDHKAYMSFLLDRCDEIKRLLQPVSGGKVNPEIDHTVIIKMIRSLLVAAKVKCAKLGLNTGLAHCDRFLSQVDLITTLVQADCLDLIPSGNLDEHTLRKLRDLLIEKELWTLALDVSTKAGLDTQGVWATWGKACLKMGYFDQARDKFYHCFDKILNEDLDDWVILSYPKESTSTEVTATPEGKDVNTEDSASKRFGFVKNRPLKDPPLLTEILQILHTLSLHGSHGQNSHQHSQHVNKHTPSNTRGIYYEESLYYLLTYGTHASILDFFLKHEEFDECLAFVLQNDLEPDLFFNVVYLYCLRYGALEKLHDAIKHRDASLLIWKKYLIYICHNLEKRQYLCILYQLQLFMRDYVRAAMTCIRFYTNEANNYSDLYSRAHILLEAQKHLESELQVETLSRKRRKSTISLNSGQGILTMEMEPLEIDRHINTICRQMEIAKFLSNSEKEERAPAQFLNLFPDMDYDSGHSPELPTLFGNQQQKIYLAVLAILCGRDIEEGFGIAFRIMQDYNLPQQKVYSLAGHVLALKNNIVGIEQLVKCCHTSGTSNSYVIADYVLTHCVKLLLNHSYSEPNLPVKNHVDTLVRLITDIELKINAYIESKQLKAAYLLAVKHSRAQDIRKILKESDRLGQHAIKAICMKWLQQEPKSKS